MSDRGNDTHQGQGQMGLFGGTGPVLGGTAGGKDYSMASMLERAGHKQSGDSSKQDGSGTKAATKELKGPILSSGTQDLLEGSGLLPGAKGGWEPNTPAKDSAAPGTGSYVDQPERPKLHTKMSEGARGLLEGSGLLQKK